MRAWSLSDIALTRPVGIGMALCAIFVLGFIGFVKMPLSFLPLNQAPRLYARVQLTSNTSPEVLEREVIRPLEEQIAGIRDLQQIQVGSGAWGVRINLEFLPSTDVDARKLELRERIALVEPQLDDLVTRIDIGSYTNLDEPALEMRIASDRDLQADYHLIEQRIVRPLERVPGVSRVELDGVAPPQLEVGLDLEAVQRTGVSLEAITRAVRTAAQPRGLGQTDDGWDRFGVRSQATPATPEALARLPLRRAVERSAEAPTAIATLGEVANISLHPQDFREAKRLNGRKAINLEIFTAAGYSIVDVSKGIREAIAVMNDDPALGGIEVLIFRDQGERIVETLADLRNSGFFGGALAALVLFAFLRRGAMTFAAALSIPLSVLAAGAVLFLRGDEINCIVMLGLVLSVGMLIDNAVVIAEAIAQRAAEGDPPEAAALHGAREVGFATIASTASTVIVFLPLVFGDPADEASMYLRPLGTTFSVVLISSLFVSQTALPLLLGRVLKPRPKVINQPVFDRLRHVYAYIIDRTLCYPRTTILVGIALAATSIIPVRAMTVRLGASSQTDDLPIRFEFAGSQSYEKVERHVAVVEAALLEHREELRIGSVACSYSDHWSNCRVYPATPFESESEAERYQQRVAAVLPEQVGIRYRLGEREFDWRENRDRNVVEFAIKGEDMGELMRLSEAVAVHLRDTLDKGDLDAPEAGGYDSITTPMSDGAEEVEVHLDPERLRQVGLTPDEVATRVAFAFAGLPLGRIQGERGELELLIRAGTYQEGADLEQLGNLEIPLADGRTVVLRALADIELSRRPWWVTRVDRQTEVRLAVRFFEPTPEANWKIVEAAMREFRFPQGYGWGRGTQWRRQKEANATMLVNLGLCLLLVYAVMASLFESFLQPLGILVTCLLGCFGAPWALWFSGTSLDTTAIVGVFILVGIVVNNGIMLVDKVTQLRQAGVPVEEALREAGRSRLRPILMTVSTTVLGLVPMLIHHPTMAGIYYHSIAIVVAGGLITSTAITLVFLPATYLLIEAALQSMSTAWRSASSSSRRAK